MPKNRVRLAALLVAASTRLGAAPPLAEEPALADLVSEALANSPEMKAAEAAVAAARQRVAQAGAVADPMVSAVYTSEGWRPNLGTMTDSSLAFMASQALPVPGVRGLRRKAATAEVAATEPGIARVRLGITALVRRAHHTHAETRALLALVDEQEELWRQIEGVARARYAVGQGAQQDVLRVQVELTRVAQQRIELQAQSELHLAELERLTGRHFTAAPLEATLGRATAAEPLEEAWARVRAASPELQAAGAEVERARVLVDLARTQWKPAVSVQAAYMNRGGLDPMWQAGVGVTLPLRKGWRQASLAEAEARVAGAEAERLAAERTLRLRTQERVAQIAAAARLAELYTEGIVPQDQMAVEAAVASYQAGKVPFLTVLEALGTLYGDRASLVRVLAGQARARAALEEASLTPTSDVPAVAMANMGSSLSAAFAGRGTGEAARGMAASPGAGMAGMGRE